MSTIAARGYDRASPARDPLRVRETVTESVNAIADGASVYLLSGTHGTERRVRKTRGFRETWRHGKNADLPLLTSSLLGAAVAAAEFADKPISAFTLSRDPRSAARPGAPRDRLSSNFCRV